MLTLKPTLEDATEVLPFDFEGASVRVVRKGDDAWFVAMDVCAILDIAKPRNAIARLDDDERAPLVVDTLGGPQSVGGINESGLYSLILTSRKAAAKRFKKWVTAEVLPAIRRTGGYMIAKPEETPEELVLRALRVAQDTVDRQKAQIATMAPKVMALERIAEADGSMCITDAAKTLQIRPKDLFRYLQEHEWIYRRIGSKEFVGRSKRIGPGLLEHKMTTIYRSDGSEKTVTQVRVTPRGLTALAMEMPGVLSPVA